MDTIVAVTTLVTVSVTVPPPTVSVIVDTAAEVAGLATVMVTVVAWPPAPPMVTVTTVGVVVTVVGASTVSVLVIADVSVPDPTVIVTTETTGVAVGAASVTVTRLVTAVPEIVIVTTDTTVVAVGIESVTVTTLVRTVPEIVIVTTETTGVVVVATASTVLVAVVASSTSVVEQSSSLSVVVTTVSVAGEELNEANTDEETAGASVTGHTVVVRSITVVTKTVDTPSGSEVGIDVTAPVPELAGQLVTVAAHEMIVWIEVADIVSVVKPTPTTAVEAFANGATVLVTVALSTRMPVLIAVEMTIDKLEYSTLELCLI